MTTSFPSFSIQRLGNVHVGTGPVLLPFTQHGVFKPGSTSQRFLSPNCFQNLEKASAAVKESSRKWPTEPGWAFVKSGEACLTHRAEALSHWLLVSLSVLAEGSLASRYSLCFHCLFCIHWDEKWIFRENSWKSLTLCTCARRQKKESDILLAHIWIHFTNVEHG